MRQNRHPVRRAFSLMEVMLALTLGMLLLLALYVSLTTQFIHAQAGRDVVAESTLARNILTRVSNDISGQLGALDKRGPADAAAAAATTDPAAAAATTAEPIVFNRGVRGEASYIILSNYRVQKPRPGDMGTEVTSDLRHTVLWIATSGSDILGLARAEYKQATSGDIDFDPTSIPEQETKVIAKEVKSMTFEYFDGVSGQWTSTWDGSIAGDEKGTATGPPAAIKITMTLRRIARGSAVTDNPDADGASYQVIVAIPASNSFPPPIE